MDVSPATLIVAAVFLVSLPAVAFLFHFHSIRCRKRARMELKRHLQKSESGGT